MKAKQASANERKRLSTFGFSQTCLKNYVLYTTKAAIEIQT